MSRAQKLAHEIAVLTFKLDRALNPKAAPMGLGDFIQVLVTDRTIGPSAMRTVAQFYVMPGDLLNAAPPKPKRKPKEKGATK